MSFATPRCCTQSQSLFVRTARLFFLQSAPPRNPLHRLEEKKTKPSASFCKRPFPFLLNVRLPHSRPLVSCPTAPALSSNEYSFPAAAPGSIFFSARPPLGPAAGGPWGVFFSLPSRCSAQFWTPFFCIAFPHFLSAFFHSAGRRPALAPSLII